MSPKPPDDPSGNVVPIGSLRGTVKKSVALKVLRNNGASVIDEGDRTIINKGDITEVYYFPSLLNRRMVHTLARKYNVSIHFFYRPEMPSQKR